MSGKEKRPEGNSNQKFYRNTKMHKNFNAYKLQEAGKTHGTSLNKFFLSHKRQKIGNEEQQRDAEAD